MSKHHAMTYLNKDEQAKLLQGRWLTWMNSVKQMTTHCGTSTPNMNLKQISVQTPCSKVFKKMNQNKTSTRWVKHKRMGFKQMTTHSGTSMPNMSLSFVLRVMKPPGTQNGTHMNSPTRLDSWHRRHGIQHAVIKATEQDQSWLDRWWWWQYLEDPFFD